MSGLNGPGDNQGHAPRVPPTSSYDIIEPVPHSGRLASLPTGTVVRHHAHFHPPPSSHAPSHLTNHAHQDFSSISNNRRVPMDNHSSDMDLSSYGDRLPPILHHGGVASFVGVSTGPPRPSHELKRPDSVITTSSIVSSDTASQAGDSSNEGVAACPPSVYAISGLYGVVPASRPAVNRRRTHSGSVGHHALIQGESADLSARGTGGDAHTLLSKSSSCAPAGTGAHSVVTSSAPHKTHRRQTSYPVTMPVSSAAAMSQPDATKAGVVDRAMVRHQVKGHRRSHSYGHHKGAPTVPHHGHHRRTGSSVIETLQTLACSGAEQEHHNESIAQFLENLRKEQQEKCEKQELHLMQDELEDLRDCGCAGCRPGYLQSLANIKVFVFLLSVLVTLQQALSSGYLNSVITTIEKRYEIPSSISGIIASMYEIGNVITVIFVSYLGSRRHIPVWIGMGVLVMGIGSIMFSLPHFLTGHHMVHVDGNSTADNICRPPRLLDQTDTDDILHNLPGLEKIKSLTEGLSSPPLAPHNNQYNREDNCIEQADKSAALPIFIFMVAQMLLGCGGSPLFTLGTTYIDNHVKRDSSSMYIGFMYSMCAFGPVCGFLLGAYLLSHHVDTFSYDVSSLNFDSTDRHWIGMWWGGFLICGASLILISIPFFFFPKELKKEKVKVYIDEKYHHATDPSIRPHKKDHKDHHHQHQPQPVVVKKADNHKTCTVVSRKNSQAVDDVSDTYGKDIKDIPRSTWKLLTNKIYLVTCLGACMELIIVSGFIVFLPKYLETQFNLSKSMASMFTGGIAIPGACIGIFFGGYILKRLQLRPKGAVQLVIFFNILCLSCYAMLFFFGCENIKMAGTTMPYYNSNGTEPFQINLTASCNFGCECDMNDVQPVCGANGLTYFSPCHAGCTSLGANSDNYTNCACVLNTMQQPSGSPLISQGSYAEVTMVPVATAGPCYKQCQMILPFMVLLFFMTLVVAVTQMPVLMVVLRSVCEEEKAFALGIQFVIFRLFGYIPSPILFGSVIDSTCLLWKSTCAGEAGGRCLLYDIEAFRYKYVGVCCGIKVLSVLTFLLDWWLIRKREHTEKKETAMTVGEVVNSIISLDKLFEPDGPLWVKMVDPEAEVREEDEDCVDEDADEEAETAENGGEIVGKNIIVSHPRRRNHNRLKNKNESNKSDTSACLERRIER